MPSWPRSSRNRISSLRLRRTCPPFAAAFIWISPVKAALPEGGAGNPVDAFVAAKLKKSNLQPAPTTDVPTLCRRLYLDLTGEGRASGRRRRQPGRCLRGREAQEIESPACAYDGRAHPLPPPLSGSHR